MFVGKSVLKNLVSFSYSLLTLTFAKSLEIYTIVLKILRISGWFCQERKVSKEGKNEKKSMPRKYL